VNTKSPHSASNSRLTGVAPLSPPSPTSENIPLKEDIQTYFAREVTPHVPDAWIDLTTCDAKDRILAEYALRDIHKPIGISDYELTRALPAELASSLPSIEGLDLGKLESPSGNDD